MRHASLSSFFIQNDETDDEDEFYDAIEDDVIQYSFDNSNHGDDSESSDSNFLRVNTSEMKHATSYEYLDTSDNDSQTNST